MLPPLVPAIHWLLVISSCDLLPWSLLMSLLMQMPGLRQLRLPRHLLLGLLLLYSTWHVVL